MIHKNHGVTDRAIKTGAQPPWGEDRVKDTLPRGIEKGNPLRGADCLEVQTCGPEHEPSAFA